MRIRVKGTGIYPKEMMDFLLRWLTENNITKIDNLSLYFNSKDARQLDIALRRKDYDIATREQENFDQLAF